MRDSYKNLSVRVSHPVCVVKLGAAVLDLQSLKPAIEYLKQKL